MYSLEGMEMFLNTSGDVAFCSFEMHSLNAQLLERSMDNTSYDRQGQCLSLSAIGGSLAT